MDLGILKRKKFYRKKHVKNFALTQVDVSFTPGMILVGSEMAMGSWIYSGIVMIIYITKTLALFPIPL